MVTDIHLKQHLPHDLFNKYIKIGFEISNFSSNLRISKNFVALRYRKYSSPYYRRHPKEFELKRSGSCEIFDDPQFQNRTDLRLTLDEPADYQLLETVYREVEYEEIIDITDVIRHIDENGLAEINEQVEQKTV